MLRRLAFVLLAAPALAGLDLALKALINTEPGSFDPRAHSWILLSLAVIAGAGLVALLPSRAVVGASALLAGGALGNLLSAWHHGWRVPNPFVVGGVAFNLADAFVLVGIVAEVVALIEVTIRFRHLLPDQFLVTRLRRRLRERRARARG